MSSKKKSWQCAVCTYINQSQVSKCEVCEAKQKERTPSDDEDVTEELTHKKLNESRKQESKTVSTKENGILPPIETPKSVAPDKNIWVCRRCTLENSFTASRCSACDTPRVSNVPTTLPPIPTAIPAAASSSETSTPSTTPSAKRDSFSSVLMSKARDLLPFFRQNDSPSSSSSGQSPEEYWICKNCSFSCNPSWSLKCDTCNTPRGNGNTELQFPVNSQNHFVQDPSINQIKQSSSTGGATSHGVWQCDRCTFVNEAKSVVCDLCHFRKPVESDLGQSTSNGGAISLVATAPNQDIWHCPQCTFLNNPSTKKCMQCGGHGDGDAASVPVLESTCRQLQRQETILADQLQQTEEIKAIAQMNEIIQYCKENKQPFVDDSFPPIPSSLYLDPKKSSSHHVQWLSPSLIAPDLGLGSLSWKVFRTPRPSDITQGLLGNCWFLSSLAVIGERSDLLEKVMLTKEYSPHGVYAVRLCKDGTWTTVVIDDLLPCDERRKLIYSNASRRQLWVPLIEKAMAKLHGCYEALIAGKCIEGLATLTGSPCESIPLQTGSKDRRDEPVDADLVWAQLLSSRESGYLMGTSCGAGNMKTEDEAYEAVGLRPRHAYSILDVKNIDGNRLLRLRNPWGKFSWKGDWSDSSPRWNEIAAPIREQLMVHGATAGVFWMSLGDMLNYFDSIDICKVRPRWQEVRLDGNFPTNASGTVRAAALTVFENTQVDLSLYQSGDRGKDGLKRGMMDLLILVFHAPKSLERGVGPLVCSSKRELKKFVTCNVILEPGEYLVICTAFNHWTSVAPLDGPPKYVLALHSSRRIMVEQKICPGYTLADALIRLAAAKGRRHEGREGMTTYYLSQGWSGIIVAVENRHPNYYIQVMCDCTESHNLVSTRGSYKSADSVPPLHSQILIVLSHLEPSEGYTVSHRLLHRMSQSEDLGDWASGQERQHVPKLTQDVYGLHQPRPL